MKIVFMGTPEFAEASLQKLLETEHRIVGVFTQPDKPKGRGYKLVAPPVKELAFAHNIPVYQPQKMRDGTALTILQELQPDLIVVVAYGKILPREILELPRYGCINVHGSLLPKYRGAGPIQWSVINGEEITGVTTMYMGEGLDTGDMILKKETPIGENETYGELHDRLKEIGAQALVETIALIEEGKAPREAQDDSLSSYAPMLDKQVARLNFSEDAKTLHNLIRGLSPWPVAHTTLDGKPVTEIVAGERYKVTLTVKNAASRYFVVVEDFIPAGFEIINTSLATESQEQAAALNAGGYSGFERDEKYDDRIAAFADYLPAGEHTYSYLVSASVAGTFAYPSLWASQMYEPAVFGRNATETLVIK